MKDHFGRNINYLRLSITDRCNLRCKYCMPHGVEFTPHEQILTYEEFLRIARAAVHLGIPRFKITAGSRWCARGSRILSRPSSGCPAWRKHRLPIES